VIFRLPALKAADFKKKYLGMKDNNVGLIRLYPLTKKNIVAELALSAEKFKYKISRNCIDFIADIYEGNMVAANQALTKIDLMIDTDQEINLDFLKKVFSKDVDFEASNLVDYSIEGNVEKIQTCITFLRENSYPTQYVIWSFIRSFRSVLFNFDSINEGKSKEDILKNIWPYEKKNLMSYSLNKLSSKKIESYLGILVRIDMQSKKIINMTDPTLAQDAATKKYVDDLYNQISITSDATPNPSGDYRENEYYLTALAVAATIAAPSGTPANGNTLILRIQDNGTARTLTWNAIYEVVGTTLPTTTVIGKKMYIGCIYNSTDRKWDVVSTIQEA
jgi:hypothetical protein